MISEVMKRMSGLKKSLYISSTELNSKHQPSKPTAIQLLKKMKQVKTEESKEILKYSMKFE